VAHPVEMPVWFMRADEKDAVDVWQVSQAWVVGTWLVGFPGAVVPLWQEAQLPVMPL
jgi:hypothetical protein